jgi:hypothetical protein
MNASAKLWKNLKDAEQAEKAATAAHDVAELQGSGPEYTAAFEAMVSARIALQQAEAEYDAATEAEESAGK